MSLGLRAYRDAIARTPLVRHVGRVHRLGGLSVEVEGVDAEVGQLCAIRRPQSGSPHLLGEVVAVHPTQVTLMAYGSLAGLRAGCEVEPLADRAEIGVGDALKGRVIDAFGSPLDGLPPPHCDAVRALRAAPLNPMTRPRIRQPLETGVRVIDSLLSLGIGQRVGIFAGSGVGKSTLLAMLARHARADVNVIALIGERGREVREFVERQLGTAGLARSVVVAAAADQPALTRVRATHAALAIAEHFRDQGQHVILTLDSVTRFAMARREVGLAAGEPPTVRGYTPSVFSDLPALCERCGTSPCGGSITALMTVLVEGDDFNEPVADTMRSVLDGHVVLSRQLAHAGHYPSIDVLASASRVMPEIAPDHQRGLAAEAVRVLSLLDRNRQLVDVGAYQAGSNPELDHALALQPRLHQWLRQHDGGIPASEALAGLAAVLKAARTTTQEGKHGIG